MGREIAEAVPEAMEVYRAGSEASGPRPRSSSASRRRSRSCVETEVQQPALVATSLAILRGDARRAGSSPTSSSATRSASSRRSRRPASLGTGEAIGLVRERGLAMAEAARERPGSMAAILGLDDEVVEKLCRRIVGVWPANYNCPGPDRRLRRERRRRGVLRRGRERSAPDEPCKLKVSGAFHSPLVARAADRLRPAIDRVQLRRADRAVHVDRDRAGSSRRSGSAALLVDQLTAPVALHAGGARARRGRRARRSSRSGPGNVLSGLVKRIDRSVKTISVNDLDEPGEAPRRRSRCRDDVLRRSRARPRSSPAARAGSAVRSRSSSRAAGATVVVGYRTGADEAEAVAREIGGRAVQADVSDPGVGAARSSRRPATSTSSSTTPA